MKDKELVELRNATMEVYAICKVLEKRKKSKTEDKIYEGVKEILENIIEQITKVEPKFNVKQEYEKNQVEVNNMVHKWNKTRTSVLGTRTKELLKSIPEINNDNLEEKEDKENKPSAQIDPKATETEKQENPISEIEKLEKKLKQIAEMREEYKKAGAYDQELLAHKEYNEVLSKINSLKSKQNDQKASKETEPEKQENPISEIEKLEKKLKQIAKMREEYKKAGAYDQEVLAHKEYNEVLSKINDLKNKQNAQKDPKIEKPNPEPDSVRKTAPEPEQEPEPKPKPNLVLNPELKPEPKTFEEILHEVQAAKNAMSDGELGRYESAKGKWLVPVQYDKGDWLRNGARFFVKKILGSIINIPRKAYSMIRTGKKQEEKMKNITENVNALSAEDFQVLLNGLQSYKGFENKVSASLRKAVQERAKRETLQENTKRNENIYNSLKEIKESYERSKSISEELKEAGLSEEQRSNLEKEKAEIDAIAAGKVREVERMREEGALAQGGLGIHGLEEESKAAREGANLSGRKFARRYSKNEELEAAQAQLKRAQREARASGNNFSEVEAFVKHEELLENNTSTKKIMGITISRSDRHHEKGVFTKEYKEDDLVKNIATIAAVTATTINMIKQIQNQAIINQKNAEISQANIDNQAMAAKGEGVRQDIIDNQQAINDGISATNDTRTATAWAAGHEHAGAVNNFTNNWGSSKEDIAFHQIMSGTVDDNTVKSLITNGLDGIKKYAVANPKYDYNALIDALTNLQSGGIDAIAKYNSAMQTLVQNAVQTGKITSTSMGAINLTPTYIETMIPLVLAGKEVTSREYRKAEKLAAKKEKKEEKKKSKFMERIKTKSRIKGKESVNAPGQDEKENTEEEEEISL